jgi:hypothetical protein
MELAVVTALAVLGLLTVLVALRDDAVVAPSVPGRPDWDPLPTPSDLVRTDFGLRMPGYDPVRVEVAFDALADAYADLLAEADAATIARARRRAEDRLARERGLAAADAPTPEGTSAGDPPLGALTGPGDVPADSTAEELRAEAALDALRRDDRP